MRLLKYVIPNEFKRKESLIKSSLSYEISIILIKLTGGIYSTLIQQFHLFSLLINSN